MPKEVKSWRPGHWSLTKRRLFQDHVYRFAEWQLQYFLGPYEGAKLGAELRGHRAAIKSIEALRNAGVRTLGEV